MHYCAKPIEKVWKVTALTRSWLLIRNKSTVSCLGQNLLQVLGWEGLHRGKQQGGHFSWKSVLCGFSTYNLDSLSRHKKEHN